jgi:Spy/CpxP family protein refolding chaperone
MKSFVTMIPVVGMIAVLAAGCSGSESTNTGQSTNAISASATSEKPQEGPHAGRPHHGPGHGGPDFLVFAALHENIDLTAEQRSTIEGLVEKGRPDFDKGARPAPDKAKTAELAAAIRSGNIDASKLQAGPQGMPNMQERQAKSAASLATLHKTLSKAQRASLVDAIVAKQAKRGEGKGEGKGEEKREGRPEGRPGGHEGGPMGHLLEGLDLTQAQKDQIKAKLDANRPTPPSEADRAAMKSAMDAKLQTFKADTFDANAFVTPPANAAQKGPMGGHADHMAKELSAVVSVLTAEQREKLAQKIEQGPPARH